ncbi:MAG: LysM peptidoglycan-binding domain-containing protein [Gammaproteobacteria bacterium]
MASEPPVKAAARQHERGANRPAVAAATDAGPCCVAGNLWDRMRAGFRFDLAADNDRIAAQRNWYIRNQAYLDRVVARASRYMHYIVEETEARDMPLELALLPIVESAFDPFAYSVADAAGPWQFIPSTGRVFGLRQDWWWDGRRDVELSTGAALSYLEQLANRFDGDYYKALASYNAGGGTVSRAVKRNLNAGKATDYWSLPLPQETRAYVPKLVALAQIVQDPAKYGVRLNPIPDRPAFVAVEIGRQIDLAQAAELADIPLTELHLYNPAHNRWATDPQAPLKLLVPVEAEARLRQGLAATPPEQLMPVAHHDVGEEDTLDALANRYNVPAESIRVMNKLAGDELVTGTTLQVPQPRLALAAADGSYEPRIAALNNRKAAVTRQTLYTVRRGDTLSAIAKRHKVGLAELARWNGLKVSKPLRAGQRLSIHGGRSGTAQEVAGTTRRSGKEKVASSNRVKHKVQPGETLYGLARRFSVSAHDIARWNDFSANRQLRAGEVLKIFRN